MSLLSDLSSRAINHVETLAVRLESLTGVDAEPMTFRAISLSCRTVYVAGMGPDMEKEDDGGLRTILFACRRFTTSLLNQIRQAEKSAGDVELWAAELK